MIEVIAELCDIIEDLVKIVKRQQEEIERAKIENKAIEEIEEMQYAAMMKIRSNDIHLKKIRTEANAK